MTPPEQISTPNPYTLSMSCQVTWCALPPHNLTHGLPGRRHVEGERAARGRGRASDVARALCPRCGQANERTGNNNHMACWACQQHYCFLCREVLGRRGGGLHFGKRGGCQQHTVLAQAA